LELTFCAASDIFLNVYFRNKSDHYWWGRALWSIYKCLCFEKW